MPSFCWTAAAAKLPSYAFDDFGRGAMVIDDSLQYAEDVPAAMDDAVREMKHWVTVV